MGFPWSNPFDPPPAPPAFGAGHVLPESSASWVSRLTLHWIGSFLNVGFSRPLMQDDFWELPTPRHTNTMAENVEQNFYSRCPPERRSLQFRDSTPAAKDEKESVDEKDPHPEEGKYDESLFGALHTTFKRRIWLAGLLLLAAETLKTTTPLLSKVFLTWLTESYVYHRLSESDRALAQAAGFSQPAGVGHGIGLAFALCIMQVAASLLANHAMLAGQTTGLYVRTGTIGAIFRKSLRLSGKARSEHSVGQITTMISADAERLDQFAGFGHYLWISPIQLILGIGLLIGQLGYSALVGLGVIIVGMPVQFIFVMIMLRQRQKGVKITDKRVRLTTEVLQGIRLIKVYGWEKFYTQQIAIFRKAELDTIRQSTFAASMLIALFGFVPILATILSFITYALTGHDLNVAVIFTSLQFFNVIRTPLILLPIVLHTLTDALVSLARISKFLLAEELGVPYLIEPAQSVALHVDGDFEWDAVPNLNDKKEEKELDPQEEFKHMMEEKKKKKEEEKKKKKAQQPPKNDSSGWWKSKKSPQDNQPLSPAVADEKGTVVGEIEGDPEEPKTPEETPFGLKDLKMDVSKGDFVAVVGRVGSGKSSLLQALIGEMKRVRGEVIFGGSVAYVPQAPWIQNTTFRENILFGQANDEDRFHETIQACSLGHDLSVLPNGDATEIGEKGINLSGGQKARVSLARAAYSFTDIVLLDDPLSAVDAYVGRSILDNCILDGPLAKRTRILVTHALHVLDKTDYIYVMDNGKIAEQGTYTDLMSNSVIFRRLVDEYGSLEANQGSSRGQPAAKQHAGPASTSNKADDVLMQLEERQTGAVTWGVYKNYLRNAGGLFWAPIIVALLLLQEAGNVSTNLFLGFWTGNTLPHWRQGAYMAAYGGIGAGLAVATFSLTYTFIVVGLKAGLRMYKKALAAVLNSPTSFFDTTPMGRILSRLSKDQDVIDTQLPFGFLQFSSTFIAIFGTIGLVFYTFPYLGIIFIPLATLYYGASVYYRRSSVETKRVDALLRSILYGSYSETLTGLPTIRAYGRQTKSIKAADYGLDMENRAFIMTIAMQRWLALRLDFFGNILILGIGLFAAAKRNSVNPAKVGVVLTYTLGMTQVFAEVISLFATNEQNMNAVERVLHYADLPSEGNDSSKIEPSESWPSNGQITFNNVKMSYREGLPLVLKGVDIKVNPGEQIGIVGRTGSGKSSLIQALLRIVELQDGSINIDGEDISKIDLTTLRTRLAFVPQDATLFLGTLRDNLDPQRLRTDAELISVLQRAWLLPKDTPVDPAVEAKFSLDSTVSDEGSNYSAGEKQLLALCRALVKNSRIIILDEATSSVDVETDSKVQRTIHNEFATSTLLCIAHRLNTIAHYDRILVMDDGHVAEFDTVLNLFDKPDSIFRALCNEANLSRTDVLRLRAEHSR